MNVEQRIWSAGVWNTPVETADAAATQLALVFASPTLLAEPALWTELHARYPSARIVGCSTAGEICGIQVLDDSAVVTAIRFDHTTIAVASALISEAADSVALGALVVSRLATAGLAHVLVLSEGTNVNGSGLVAGMTSGLPPGVAITGGLSADGPRFAHTAVCLDGPHPTAQIVAIGFYGDRLQVGYGSVGGWDPFGPERTITRSEGNVLYELDGEPALDLYKRYLGDHAEDLPASGLLFPLAIRNRLGDTCAVVRTILAVDEVARSLTFAGDVPEGYHARLMHANLQRLVEGAAGAATTSVAGGANRTELAILISCVGRKLVLKQRVEEEVEAVRDVVGQDAVIAGFYSYGEIAPFSARVQCELHNQTMTITTLAER
ncbi:MAG: FIST N-terminal domain-containing protein [Kofleriaceae bacterium]